MSAGNPSFQCRDRASYEFVSLLRHLPRNLHGAQLTPEQLQQVDAADSHAENARAVLLDGLQSLGRVLWSAGVNESFPPDVSDCARVGMLVTEVALQIELLSQFREEVAEHNLRIAEKGPHK